MHPQVLTSAHDTTTLIEAQRTIELRASQDGYNRYIKQQQSAVDNLGGQSSAEAVKMIRGSIPLVAEQITAWVEANDHGGRGKPAKISPEDQAIEDAITKGIRGDSGVQNAFATRLGISPDDLPKVLDKIEQDLPDLAGEINRIRFNYPTKNRKIGSVLGGRMAAAADELGIPKATGGEGPRPIPVDEAAQQRLAQTEAPAPPPSYTPPKDEPAIKPLEGSNDQVELRGTVSSMEEAEQALEYQASQLGGDTVGSIDEMPDGSIVVSTVGQRQIRQIDRPQQWQQGKQNYQSAANSAMSDLYSDIRLGDGALNAIKRVPEKIRDQFKTTEEATAYIENEVVPDLQASKVSGQEIDTIRSYLYEIAGSKPYATREAYEAGTKANQRGRPRKQAN